MFYKNENDIKCLSVSKLPLTARENLGYLKLIALYLVFKFTEEIKISQILQITIKIYFCC